MIQNTWSRTTLRSSKLTLELKTIKGIEEILKKLAVTNGDNSTKNTHGKTKQKKVILPLTIFNNECDLSK